MDDASRRKRQLIDHLFERASALPAAARQSFLDDCCPEAEVRREVESLLSFAAPEGAGVASALQAAAWLMDALPDQPVTGSAGRNYKGRRIGVYRVSDLLGAGGMGSVYRAVREDSEFEHQVAVKFLREDLGESLKQRFRRERQIMAHLAHPHIAQILDGATTPEGVPYFVMEYIDGKPITEYCRTRQVPLAGCLEIFLQVCAAVEYAHQQGVVHRDIKPGNILVTGAGIPKLLDFGIAKSVPSPAGAEIPTALTEAGMVFGSLDYLSPEQARGGEIDQRSDVFSLGVVLYEVLTGVKPFSSGTRSDTLASILTREAPPASRQQPDVPRELDAVVARALRKDREERYASAGAMLADLKAIHLDLERRARRPAWWRRPGAWAAALALAGAGFAVLRLTPFRPAAGAAGTVSGVHMRKITTVGDVKYIAVSPDGKYAFYARTQGDIWVQQLAAPGGRQLLPPLKHTYGNFRVSSDSNFLYYCDALVDGTLYRVPILGGTPQKVFDRVIDAPSFSPDGSKIACLRFVGTESQILVAEPDGGNPRLLLTVDQKDGRILSTAWLPDGRKIAFFRNDTPTDKDGIWTVPAQGGAAKRVLLDATLQRILSFTVLPSGDLVLDANSRAHSEGKRQLWIARNGAVERLTNDLNEYRSVTATAQGEVVSAQVNSHSNVWVGPPDGPLRQVTSGTASYHSLAWMPDGRLIAILQAGGNRELWSLAGDGSAAHRLTSWRDPTGFPAVCRDGRTVLVSRNRDGAYNIWRIDPDGGNATQLTTGNLDNLPECGADSQSVFFLSQHAGHFRICRIALSGGAPDCLEEATESSPLVSPDAQWLAYGSTEISSEFDAPKVRLWPLGGGKPITLNAPWPWSNRVRWAPDSKGLLIVPAGSSDIWVYPIDGRPRRQYSHFQLHDILRFAISLDGKQVAMIRTITTSDGVLFSGLR